MRGLLRVAGWALVGALCCGGLAPAAHAGGYDIPVLYSARNMGMGGTGVSTVSSATALFMNPAGLGNVGKASLLGDLSFITGKLKASPGAPNQDIWSERTNAPFFLVGGAYRVHPWFTVGLAVFPVAAASGTYRYELPGDSSPTFDKTRLTFIEIAPGVAMNIPAIGLSIGASYRITVVRHERVTRLTDGSNTSLDADLRGVNWASFRLGLQWRFTDNVAIGIAYRHRANTTLTSGSGTLANTEVKDVSARFKLPPRLSFGIRADYAWFGAAVDLEYGVNHENRVTTIRVGGNDVTDNVFAWEDQLTLRTGLEARFLKHDRMAFRLGYIWDQKTTNRMFPTAFGTPPSSTHVGTVGLGYKQGPWEANLAYAFRMGKAHVTEAEVAAGKPMCPLTCDEAGHYEMRLNGLYADLSYDWR